MDAPWLISCLCTVLMALWVSRCYEVTGCKLLNLQSAELTLGVINQTLRQCEPRNVFLDILSLFAYQSVNSPAVPTSRSHREAQRESDKARAIFRASEDN